jgi:hypothetical protein
MNKGMQTYMNKLNQFSLGALLVLLASLAMACHQPSSANTNPATAASPVAQAANAQAPAQNPEDSVPRVKVEDAKAEVAKGTAVIIDVRGTEAYKTAHIKGAIDYPLARLEQSDFKDMPKGKRIIAYCT